MATIRSSFKNYERATKAPWFKDWGYGGTPASTANQLSAEAADANIDYAWSNAFQMKGRTADSSDDRYMVGIDSDNDIRVNGEAYLGMGTTMSFALGTLTGTPTHAFFLVPTGFPQMLATQLTANFGTANGAALTATITHESALSSTSGLLPAPGAGSVMHTGSINLNATANTVQTLTLPSRYGVPASGAPNFGVRVINPGDTISIKFSGAVTSLANLVVNLTVLPGAKGTFAVYSDSNGAVGVDQPFFTANENLSIKAIAAVWSAAGTAGGAVTGDIQVEASGTAPGSGTSALNAAFSLKTAANTPINITPTSTTTFLSATLANRDVPVGSTIDFHTSGTLTSLTGVVIVVWLQAGQQRNGGFLQTSYPKRKEVNWQLQANTNQGTQVIWGPADQCYEVVDYSATYTTAAGGALNGNISIDAPGTAPGSGTLVSSDNANGGLNFNTTTNTPQWMTPASLHLRIVPPGAYLSLKLSAGKQSLAGLNVNVSMRPQA